MRRTQSDVCTSDTVSDLSRISKSLAYHEVRSRSGPIGPRVKLSLRLPSGRSRSFRNSQRGPPWRDDRAGCRRRSGVITENGRVFAAITGTTVTKQRHRHTTSTRIGVGRTICCIIVRFSRNGSRSMSEKRKVVLDSIQDEGSLFVPLFFFSLCSLFFSSFFCA